MNLKYFLKFSKIQYHYNSSLSFEERQTFSSASHGYPRESFREDYGITGVRLSVCLFVYLFVCLFVCLLPR